MGFWSCFKKSQCGTSSRHLSPSRPCTRCNKAPSATLSAPPARGTEAFLVASGTHLHSQRYPSPQGALQDLLAQIEAEGYHARHRSREEALAQAIGNHDEGRMNQQTSVGAERMRGWEERPASLTGQYSRSSHGSPKGDPRISRAFDDSASGMGSELSQGETVQVVYGEEGIMERGFMAQKSRSNSWIERTRRADAKRGIYSTGTFEKDRGYVAYRPSRRARGEIMTSPHRGRAVHDSEDFTGYVKRATADALGIHAVYRADTEESYGNSTLAGSRCSQVPSEMVIHPTQVQEPDEASLGSFGSQGFSFTCTPPDKVGHSFYPLERVHAREELSAEETEFLEEVLANPDHLSDSDPEAIAYTSRPLGPISNETSPELPWLTPRLKRAKNRKSRRGPIPTEHAEASRWTGEYPPRPMCWSPEPISDLDQDADHEVGEDEKARPMSTGVAASPPGSFVIGSPDDDVSIEIEEDPASMADDEDEEDSDEDSDDDSIPSEEDARRIHACLNMYEESIASMRLNLAQTGDKAKAEVKEPVSPEISPEEPTQHADPRRKAMVVLPEITTAAGEPSPQRRRSCAY